MQRLGLACQTRWIWGWVVGMECRRGNSRLRAWVAPRFGSVLPALLLSLTFATGCGDDSGNPVAPNQSPVATIDAPSSGARFVSGDTVQFRGRAADPEDGGLSGGALVWSTNLDGLIGTGTSASTDRLAVGEHLITLVATDSEGLTDSAFATITITRRANNFPIASIDAPPSGAHFVAGDTVHFLGRAIDPEDGCFLVMPSPGPPMWMA